MAYAETTKVPVGKSKSDIDALVKKYGADAFGIMEKAGHVQIAFSMEGRNILFKMQLPEAPQAERSIWRAMLLTIKGKLESAERGIETFEEAFLSNIVMADGRTVSEHAAPAIESHYNGNPNVPLLGNFSQ
mgnify:FL=1